MTVSGVGQPRRRSTAGRWSLLLALATLAVTWLSCGVAFAETPAFPSWASGIVGHPFVGVITTSPVVALTIDDVRTSRLARTMADELTAAGLHASYFCVASELSTDDALYEASRGIEMEDHGWTHVPLGPMHAAEAAKMLSDSAHRLQDMTGAWPLWYRSPYLQFGPQGAAETSAAGLLCAGASALPKDYLDGTTPVEVLNRVSAGLRPGAVIDLHVTTQTVLAIPFLELLLKQRGYEALTMSELATVGPPARTDDMLWKEPTTLSTVTVSPRPRAGHLVRLNGSVGPPDGRKVEVQIRRYRANGATKLVARKKVTLGAAGRWSVKLKLRRASYRVRVVVPVSPMCRGNVSAWVKFRVH